MPDSRLTTILSAPITHMHACTGGALVGHSLQLLGHMPQCAPAWLQHWLLADSVIYIHAASLVPRPPFNRSGNETNMLHESNTCGTAVYLLMNFFTGIGKEDGWSGITGAHLRVGALEGRKERGVDEGWFGPSQTWGCIPGHSEVGILHKRKLSLWK